MHKVIAIGLRLQAGGPIVVAADRRTERVLVDRSAAQIGHVMLHLRLEAHGWFDL